MLTRRTFLILGAASAALLTGGLPAWAQAGDATGFVRQLGDELVAVVNGPGSVAEKRRRLDPLIEQSVDIDAIGRFCLGRFWNSASPQQRQEFQSLFHQVLLTNIAGKLGDFQGVRFAMTTTSQREGGTFVGTVISRPNQQPNNVQWVVSNASGQPRIIDVIAEGTSLRLTQRSDYAAFLSRNNNNVDALLNAMRRQTAG